ncbi:hypothetical protein PLICRDRAFT_696510 [Plicaturopsis crispa FD-325 SS-3]|nr:hypothetical protein PLICRDRAFT_696510 [Plicaturopsis crispa FD-325 SS-3]
MPFEAIEDIDPERLKKACQELCWLYEIRALKPFQVECGRNMLRGRSTILDIPTGGGKTLAFWVALFYFWQPGNVREDCQKSVLVVSPLVNLMLKQASDLNTRGIPAVALTAQTPDQDKRLAEVAENKFRVVFVGPETANSPSFLSTVLGTKSRFVKNCIHLVIDEAHCISEWGGDDFRPDYKRTGLLRGRLPSGTPALVASATMPPDILDDLVYQLGLPADCARLAFSNAKPNIALSVRIMQHPEADCADLLALMPRDPTGPTDFPQTLIYADSRKRVENIESFYRRHAPDTIPPSSFEFYHRYIDEDRKLFIQDSIADGNLRCVSATIALGMGQDFRNIKRVGIWGVPKTFCSLVQELGRCERNPALLGEGIVWVTRAFYDKHLKLADAGLAGEQSDDDPDDMNGGSSNSDQGVAEDEGDLPADSRDALPGDADDDDEVPAPTAPTRKGKAVSAMAARDAKFLVEFIVTRGCRRVVWNNFFQNHLKVPMDLPRLPPGTRCCDNCTPELFPVETVRVTGRHKLKTGRAGKTTEAVYNAVSEHLKPLREQIVSRDWPNQHFLTGRVILDDDCIHRISTWAGCIMSLETLQDHVRWHWAPTYGDEVIKAVQTVLAEFPSAVPLFHVGPAEDRLAKALRKAEKKDLHARMLPVFTQCHTTILEHISYNENGVPYQQCKQFLTLPRRNHWPTYYEIVSIPISMASIARFSKEVGHYTTIDEYADDWHLLFSNAKQFNEEGSPIYQDAEELEEVFDEVVYRLSLDKGFPDFDRLPVPHKFQ